MKISFISIVSLICLYGSLQAELYEYRNDKNQIELSSKKPLPYILAKGYRVFSDEGILLETVPPKTSKEALIRLEQRKKQDLKKEEHILSLLKLYQSPEDILEERDAEVVVLNEQLSFFRNRLKVLKKQEIEFIEQANIASRQGKDVSELKVKLEKLRNQIETQQFTINDHPNQIESLKQKYQRDYDLLKDFLE